MNSKDLDILRKRTYCAELTPVLASLYKKGTDYVLTRKILSCLLQHAFPITQQHAFTIVILLLPAILTKFCSIAPLYKHSQKCEILVSSPIFSLSCVYEAELLFLRTSLPTSLVYFKPSTRFTSENLFVTLRCICY